LRFHVVLQRRASSMATACAFCVTAQQAISQPLRSHVINSWCSLKGAKPRLMATKRSHNRITKPIGTRNFRITPGSGFEPERPDRDSDSRGHRICPLCHPGSLALLFRRERMLKDKRVLFIKSLVRLSQPWLKERYCAVINERCKGGTDKRANNHREPGH
jgi:hypothetical protein